MDKGSPHRVDRPKSLNTDTLLLQMKTRQILLVLALDETRSLRKAAQKIGMLQPAATKLLQDLENAVGVELFGRTRRGMQPNEFGEVMIHHARLMLSDLDGARHELMALRAGSAGRLKIGAVASAIPVLIARAVVALKHEQPRLTVAIDVNTSDHLVPALMRGELELLVARPVLAERPDFDYEQLIEEPLVIVGRRGHPLAERDDLSIALLMDWPWVLLPATSPMRKVLAPVFSVAGIEQPINLVETSSVMTVSALLRESDALAVLPEDTARDFVEIGVLARIPVALPPIMGAYGIITKRDRPQRAATHAFVRCLKAVLSEHPTRDHQIAKIQAD